MDGAVREQDQVMATRLARFESGLSELRYFPTAKHVRATINGTTIVDSHRAILLWEPQRVIGHPHDPLARIDVLRSDRHVRVQRDGTVLAESSRPSLLFETGLPVRFYLPPEDVRFDRLRPSGARTTCAYKGIASIGPC